MIQLEGPIFEAVQSPGIFQDSKTFVDAIPKIDEEIILKEYKKEHKKADFKLESFLRKHFIFPHVADSPRSKLDTNSLENYIDGMWEILERQPVTKQFNDTLIPLPNPFVIPGGRFRESYYWNSYFAAEGLATINNFDLVESIIKNMVHLQKQHGLIPNGNRSYYLTRSQPPMLLFLVQILEKKYGIKRIKKYIPALEKEYLYWMQGQELLSTTNPSHQRVVLMPDGSILNRYYDDSDTPRPEAYAEDKALAENLSKIEAKKLYRNLRAACESGWNFSSRWLANSNDLETIQTTNIVPIDLNAFLYAYERDLSSYFAKLNNTNKTKHYKILADKRRDAIDNLLWSKRHKFYFDYNLNRQHQTDVESLAATAPLFVNLATQQQAKAVANKLKDDFLKPGGLIASTIETGQQWDTPNALSPLQWLAAKGLLNYNLNELTVTIIQRFLKTVYINFYKHQLILEKYNVCNLSKIAGGGEYNAQTGFDWTIGIILKFQHLLETPALKRLAEKYASFGSSSSAYETLSTSIINNYFFPATQTKQHLTNREAQCLIGLLRGKTAGEISKDINISTKTVEQYVTQLKRKLNCYSRSQIFAKAINSGLLNILMDEHIFSNE